MTVTNRDENGDLVWGTDSVNAARTEADRILQLRTSPRLNFEAQIALIETTRAVAELLNETNTAPGKLPTQGLAMLTMAADQPGIVNDETIIVVLANQPVLPAILQHNGGGVYEFLGSGNALLQADIGAIGSGNFATEYAWFVNSVEVGIHGRTVTDAQGHATHLMSVSIGDTVEIRQVSTTGGSNDIKKATTSAVVELFS